MQIIVLGMHRSGTSLTTRLINLMGAYFAPKNLWLEANADNPKGFWERTDVLAINRGLMQANGCLWYRVDRWDDSGINIPAPLAAGMSATLSELNAHKPWVLKDPRLCITLPCWLPHLTAPVAVITSRNPLEIARSLELRNGMPIEYGLALWEYHAAGIIRHAHHLPKIFTSHEAMMASCVSATVTLCDALLEHVPNLALPSTEDIVAFISPALKRAHAHSGTLTPHQQTLDAMLSGDAAFDKNIQVSEDAKRIMRELGDTVTGAPVNH
jgi:hypothetical protein